MVRYLYRYVAFRDTYNIHSFHSPINKFTSKKLFAPRVGL